MKYILILFIILPFTLLYSQNVNPYDIIKNIKNEIEKVNDYQAELNIKVDISFVKIPDVTAKIYFKKPDKIHIDSKSFAILPKQGLTLNPFSLIDKNYTAIYEGIKEYNNQKHYQIKIIPEESNNRISLITLLVDINKSTITKMITLGEKSGKTEIEFDYTKIDDKYWLPQKIIVTADVGNFRPRGINNNPPNTTEKKTSENEQKTGKIFITYSNYIINKGLDDNIFSKKDVSKP